MTYSINAMTRGAQTQEGTHTMTKTYSSKSNALRAFKTIHADLAADCEDNADIAGQFLVQVDAGWTFDLGAIEQTQIDNEQEGDDVVSGEDEVEDAGDETPEEVAALTPIKGTGSYKDVPLRRRSVEMGAVSWAHEVFDSMPAGTKRKAAIAEAVRQGIAFYTARTQYQKWLNPPAPKAAKTA